MAGARRVDSPEIDVPLFGDGNGRVYIRIDGTKAGAEVINSGRNEKQRAWSPVAGQRFIQSMTERYGLDSADLPIGMRSAFAASSWLVVKSCATRTVAFDA